MKYTVLFVQLAYTFVSVEAALSVAPMFPLIAKELRLDQTQLNLISGVCLLTQGFANFIIVPYSNIFGRRQACLTCGVLIILTEVWIASASSYHSLLAARAMNGLVTAISESVMVQVINDLFFSHERATWLIILTEVWIASASSYHSLLAARAMNGLVTAISESVMVQVINDLFFSHARATWLGLYFSTYFIGVFIGTIIAGEIASRHGWRSFFWLAVALSTFNLVTLLFAFPETKYKRSNVGAVEEGSPQHPGFRVEEKNAAAVAPQESGSSPPTAAQTPSLVGQGRPAKRQFALWQPPDPQWKRHLLRDLFTPFRVCLFPIIIWTAFVVGGNTNINLFFLLTESQTLSAPPHNFSTAAVGFSNFAGFIGGILGLVTAGPLSDYIMRRLARQNHGVREAETRLWALVPYTILMTIGVTIGGLALQHQWAWPFIHIFGLAGAGLTATSIPTIAVAYAIDCYKPLAGEIMVVATVLKNTPGYCMSY